MKCFRCLLLALCLCPLLFANKLRTVPYAVEVGQGTVDAKRLPLVCLTVALQSGNAPLDTVRFEQMPSGIPYEVDMQKAYTLGGKPKYPFGADEQKRMQVLVIVSLPPGHYRVDQAIYKIDGDSYHARVSNDRGSLTSDGQFYTMVTMSFPKTKEYEFDVEPGMVNYVGGVLTTADWMAASKKEGRSQATHSVLHCERRDQRWAASLIPGMKELPSRSSPLGGVQPERKGGAPTLVQRLAPQYPAEEYTARIAGKAVVMVSVDRSGSVVQAEVVEASRPAFGESAKACVLQWRFSSAGENERSELVRMKIPFTFEPDTAAEGSEVSSQKQLGG